MARKAIRRPYVRGYFAQFQFRFTVAIDGSKFKAVNAKAKSYTREKLKRRLGEIDAAIDPYMGELDRSDEVCIADDACETKTSIRFLEPFARAMRC